MTSTVAVQRKCFLINFYPVNAACNYVRGLWTRIAFTLFNVNRNHTHTITLYTLSFLSGKGFHCYYSDMADISVFQPTLFTKTTITKERKTRKTKNKMEDKMRMSFTECRNSKQQWCNYWPQLIVIVKWGSPIRLCCLIFVPLVLSCYCNISLGHIWWISPLSFYK